MYRPKGFWASCKASLYLEHEFSPFEGGRGDETIHQHPGNFIPLTPFKGGKLLRQSLPEGTGYGKQVQVGVLSTGQLVCIPPAKWRGVNTPTPKRPNFLTLQR